MCYSIFLNLVIGGYFAVLVCGQLITSFVDHDTGLTLFFIVSIREIMSCIMFGYTLIISLTKAKDHAKLLNVLVELEQGVNAYLMRFNCIHRTVSKHPLESNWTSVALIGWQFVINASIVTIFSDINMTVRLLWMSTMQYCLLFYIRMLMIVVTQNLRKLRICFCHNCFSLLATDLLILDNVTSAKNMLKNVFSGILLMGLLFDFITKLVTVFWWIYSIVNAATYPFTFNAFYVCFGYVLPFWLKWFLFAHAMEGFADEVSYIRYELRGIIIWLLLK